MSLAGAPLFCDSALAARLERAEAELMAQAARAAGRRAPATDAFVMPLAGGVATYAGAGSPFNKVAGLGFGGLPDSGSLDEAERAFSERGAAVQIELSELADPEIGHLLSDRGYELASFENVLGLALDVAPEIATPPGVHVRASDDAELEAWLEVVADAAMHADTEGLPSHETFSPDVVRDADRDFVAAGVIRYSALRDGVLAGGASFRIADGVAQMTGAATAPAHRRHGIQTALLTARLAAAAAAGCDIAVVTTQPGSRSQRNVQRRGFDLLYARAILVKPPPARPITIRFAHPAERAALEDLQRRSSMHEPMYRAQLAAQPDAIALGADQIEAGLVRVAEQDGAVVGFAVLLEARGDGCELDGLFVEPGRMRAGVGRRLIDDAKLIAGGRGAARIDVVANPQAVAFYRAVGFLRVGEAPTRFGPAPRMSLPLDGAAAPHKLGAPERAIAERLIDEIDRFNLETTGIADIRELLATETGDGDELLGGIYGWSWGGTCWIAALWVREDMRKRGVGSRLLRAAEAFARDHGCVQLALDTHTFQAPDFYARHGFETVGRLRGHPAGHDHLLMRRVLESGLRPRRA